MTTCIALHTLTLFTFRYLAIHVYSTTLNFGVGDPIGRNRSRDAIASPQGAPISA